MFEITRGCLCDLSLVLSEWEVCKDKEFGFFGGFLNVNASG